MYIYLGTIIDASKPYYHVPKLIWSLKWDTNATTQEYPPGNGPELIGLSVLYVEELWTFFWSHFVSKRALNLKSGKTIRSVIIKVFKNFILIEMPCCQMSWNALLPNSLKCHVAKQFKMSCCQPCWNTPLPNMSKCHVEIPCWLRYWNTHYFFEKVSFSVHHWLMNKSANNRANKKARNAILQWSEDSSVLRWCEYCRR